MYNYGGAYKSLTVQLMRTSPTSSTWTEALSLTVQPEFAPITLAHRSSHCIYRLGMGVACTLLGRLTGPSGVSGHPNDWAVVKAKVEISDANLDSVTLTAKCVLAFVDHTAQTYNSMSLNTVTFSGTSLIAEGQATNEVLAAVQSNAHIALTCYDIATLADNLVAPQMSVTLGFASAAFERQVTVSQPLSVTMTTTPSTDAAAGTIGGIGFINIIPIEDVNFGALIPHPIADGTATVYDIKLTNTYYIYSGGPALSADCSVHHPDDTTTTATVTAPTLGAPNLLIKVAGNPAQSDGFAYLKCKFDMLPFTPLAWVAASRNITDPAHFLAADAADNDSVGHYTEVITDGFVSAGTLSATIWDEPSGHSRYIHLVVSSSVNLFAGVTKLTIRLNYPAYVPSSTETIDTSDPPKIYCLDADAGVNVLLSPLTAEFLAGNYLYNMMYQLS